MKKQFIHNAIKFDQLPRKTINDQRVYETPTGQRYPSVTTILKQHNQQQIEQWRNRVGHQHADAVMHKASSRGTKVHKHCEDYCNNILVEQKNQQSYNNFLQIKKILDLHVDNIVAVEAPLYSHYLRAAGTADLIAQFDHKLSIIDFKTSTKPKKKHWIDHYFMQGAAYCTMFEELTSIPINQIVIIIQDDTKTIYDKADVFIDNRGSPKDNNSMISKFIQYRDIYEKHSA